MGACFSGTEAYEDENKMSKDEMEYWQKRNERKKNIYQKMKKNEKTRMKKSYSAFHAFIIISIIDQ